MTLITNGAAAVAAVNPIAGATVSTLLGLVPANRLRTPAENERHRAAEVQQLYQAALAGNEAALNQLNTWLLDGGLHSDPKVGVADTLKKFYAQTKRVPPPAVAQALGISLSNVSGQTSLGVKPGNPVIALEGPQGVGIPTAVNIAGVSIPTPVLLIGALAVAYLLFIRGK